VTVQPQCECCSEHVLLVVGPPRPECGYNYCVHVEGKSNGTRINDQVMIPLPKKDAHIFTIGMYVDPENPPKKNSRFHEMIAITWIVAERLRERAPMCCDCPVATTSMQTHNDKRGRFANTCRRYWYSYKFFL
jgi:hypothetical protein